MKAPSILYINLDTSHQQTTLSQATSETTSAGFDIEHHSHFETDGMNQFESKLKERRWDAVIIGLGSTEPKVLPERLESLVNTIKEYDGNIKFGFSAGPGDVRDSAKRLFPMIKPLAV
ncbi:hypothetical protein AA313_de0209583 [Arthrobotrys entomopaga]|nr:hypothetical protein AA313_de0209583 [Arthrobotrys entomopaga]